MVATTLPSVASAGIAAGTSQRRLKKLGFKQLLTIQRGSSGNGLALLGATEAAIENEDQQDRGLGVDASEVTEHHLQAALSSTQLASDGNSADTSKVPGSSRPAYHIPTPEAKAVLSTGDYAQLYPSGAYSDPVTYVRSSETVEQAVRGPSYCMDEDDNDWLEDRNRQAGEAITAALKNMKSPVAKGKSRERTRQEMIASLARDNNDLRVITCEEYEMVIGVMEQVCTDKVPFAHLDVSKLPEWETFTPYFSADGPLADHALPELPELPWEHGSSTSGHHSKNGLSNGASNGHSPSSANNEWSPANPYRNLNALRQVAEIVYPFWKERREERGGKALVPVLNFDESNENDPYVCFRRREVKTVRKTRKTDVVHLEKLVKLRLEMQQAVTLMTLMAQREKTKRASLMHDRLCWQTTRELLEVKKQWGITGPNAGQDDEELMAVDKRDEMHGVAGAASRKKRRVEEGAAAAAAAAAAQNMATVTAGTNGVVKLSKKVRPEDGASAASSSAAAAAATAAAASSSVGLGSAISDRVQAVQAYIERECQRKADGDVGWEEGSDTAFQPMLVPAHLRNFRPIHAESNGSQIPWSTQSPSSTPASFSRAGRPASFRRRLGRGGRMFLDRRLPTPSPVPANLSDWPRPDSTLSRGSEATSRQTAPSSSQHGAIEAPKDGSAEKKARRWQASQQAALTGPFAFSPSIRPSLLNAAFSTLHSHNETSGRQDAEGGRGDEDTGAADASSPTSSSTQQSKDSNASTAARATSTQPTDVGEEMHETKRDMYESSEEDDDEDEEETWFNAHERWSRLQERWRYDDEGGRWAGLGLCGLGGMEDDDEAIVDDFDQRFMRFRMTLLEESDLMKLSTDLTNVMQAQQAADAPPAQPVGYAIFRGETPSMFHQQQAQQQHAQQQAQRQQAQAAQQAAASLAAGNSLAPHLQGQAAAAAAAAMAMPSNPMARAVQTNVGGPLTALQQQQQLHQAHLQLALHQQQQRAAAAAAAQAQAQAMSSSQQAQLQGTAAAGPGTASPIPRPRSGQQVAMPHPLSQSYNGGVPTSSPMVVNGNPGTGGAGARYTLPNGQSPSPFPNGMMSSPQMQAHLAAASSGAGQSASPITQQRSSPHMAHSNSFHSSPAQKHVSPLTQQQQQQQQAAAAAAAVAAAAASQQQQQQQRSGSINGGFVQNGNGVMPQMNPLAAAAALQQAQAALQAQQQQQQQQPQSVQSAQFSHQLMAMHAALTQSQAQNGGQLPMQLKLPANRTRALEIAQQAAKLAATSQQRGGASATPPPGTSQAQLGMGLLTNLQQQISLAQQQQQQQQQQHNFAAMNGSVSGATNNSSIMAGVAISSNGKSPNTKGRT